MRLNVSVNGKRLNPFSGRSKLVFTIVSHETNQGPLHISPVPVQNEGFRKDGWAYLLMQPGTYDISLGEHYRHPGDPYEPATYLLYVPAHRHFRYVGMFEVTGFGKKWNAREGKLMQTTLEFEPGAAQLVAEEEFGALGALSLAELQPVNGLAGNHSLPELGAISVATSAPQTLEPPHWSERAISDYVNVVVLPLPSGGGQAGAAVGTVVLAWDLTAGTFATIAGAIEGKATAKKWRPLLANLNEEVMGTNLNNSFKKFLGEQLRAHGITNFSAAPPDQPPADQPGTNSSPHLLRAEIREVGLFQGQKRDLIAVRVGMRFRITDTQEEHCLYDRVLSPCSDFNRSKDYFDKTGRDLFASQIAATLSSGLDTFLGDVAPGVKEEKGEAH